MMKNNRPSQAGLCPFEGQKAPNGHRETRLDLVTYLKNSPPYPVGPHRVASSSVAFS